MAELFHYTNVNGLEGILRSQNLQATHFRFLNDSSELTFAAHHIVALFAEEISAIVRNDEIRFGSIQQQMKDAFIAEEAKNFFKICFTQIDMMSPIFVTSLCKHQDTATKRRGLLSQWRGYGPDGGYCIAFDEEQFKELLTEPPDSTKIAVKAWDPVVYLETDEKPDLQKFVGIAGIEFKRKFNKLCELGTLDLPAKSRIPFTLTGDEPNVGELLGPIFSTLPFVKHRCFEEENEYRIVLAAYAKNMSPPEGKPPPFKFRKRGQTLVPYVEVFDNKRLPVTRIIVGPGKGQVERAYGVEQLVASLDLEISVTMSEIPLNS